MKYAVLTMLALGLSASMASAAQDPVKLVPDMKVELESYFVNVWDVKSVDVLINYKMIEVDCKGVPYQYSLAKNKLTGETFVSREARMAPAIPCPPMSTMTQAQDGIKFTLKAARGANWVSQVIMVPVGSVVELVQHPEK